MSTVTTPITKLGRLKKRSEFLHVANRNGKSLYCAKPTLVVQMRKHPERDNDIKCGFTATKRIGNAVIRNRAKRRLRACANAYLPRLGRDGYDYVFIARDTTADAPWESLCVDIEKALLRLK
ncbi:MAG: ribonuclease P protein component [Robiginitomaculum sp.]|nr:MAG: ribonuclease P protein component [Robiginitomaculum sp.]